MTKGAESDSEMKVKHVREILKLTTKFINEVKHTGQVRISLDLKIISRNFLGLTSWLGKKPCY